MSPYRLLLKTAALSLVLLTAVSWAGQNSGSDPNTVPIIKPLIGSTIPEVVERLGRPIQSNYLSETGGMLMIFETARHDRYVIETDGTGRVVDAFVEHSEPR